MLLWWCYKIVWKFNGVYLIKIKRPWSCGEVGGRSERSVGARGAANATLPCGLWKQSWGRMGRQYSRTPTEEALRPTGRADEEVSRFSVAPRGKPGEVGWEVLEWWEPPALDAIGPAEDPRVGEAMWLRVLLFWVCGLCRRGLRVSSKSLIVSMWWGLDGAAPG